MTLLRIAERPYGGGTLSKAFYKLKEGIERETSPLTESNTSLKGKELSKDPQKKPQ